MKRRSRVVAVGWSHAAYRAGLILKYFADRSESYCLNYVSQNCQDRYPSYLDKLIFVATTCLLLLRADIMVVMPMSHVDRIISFPLRLAKILGVRIVVDFYISAYETKVIDRNLWAPGCARASSLSGLDNAALRFARPSIFLSKAEHAYYCSVIPNARATGDVAIIPLVVPQRAQARTPFLTGIEATPTVVWWGRAGNPLHGFDVIAEAIRILIARGFRATFGIFCANDESYLRFREQYSDIADLPNVLFSCDYSFNNGALTEYVLQRADLALGTFGHGKKAKTVIVNKVLDAASLGVPILTQPSEGLLEYFVDGVSISTCEPCPVKVASGITSLLDAPRALSEIGREAKRCVDSVFSPEAFERLFHNALSDV